MFQDILTWHWLLETLEDLKRELEPLLGKEMDRVEENTDKKPTRYLVIERLQILFIEEISEVWGIKPEEMPGECVFLNSSA